MVGIVVVSHGALAQELLNSAAMLVGEGNQLAAAGIFPGDTPEEFLERVSAAAASVDQGAGVVGLADVFGGTPNNTLFRVSRQHNIRIVTGVNLPMLIYAITERTEETTQEELVNALLETGKAEISEFGK